MVTLLNSAASFRAALETALDEYRESFGTTDKKKKPRERNA